MFQGNEMIPVTNKTMELKDCRDQWFPDDTYDCWCLEDILYTETAEVPRFQRLSIYAPRAYLNTDGTPDRQGTAGEYSCSTAPVVFVNNAAGYMQMPHTWLGGPRCNAEIYLRRGMVYVTAGCRGRESRDGEGRAAGKSPATLVDLKTVIRFLRHNREALPGDMDKIITVGTSAGGAMSSLLGCTGDNENYLPLLRKNGAFMEESDAVFASQCYCPIIDLDHADQAYEWCFGVDRTCEDSPAGPAETMSAFQEALSEELKRQYIAYVNGMGLRHPDTGEALKLSPEGRSGSFYDYLMERLGDSASVFLKKLEHGELKLNCSAGDYLAGRYEEQVPAPPEPGPRDADLHHIGPGAALQEKVPEAKTMGEMLCRPPKGTPWRELPQRYVTRKGKEKKDWLTWDGTRARVLDLDTYVLQHRRRMKPCTSFDTLSGRSGENQVMGSEQQDYMHYNPGIGEAISRIRNRFPKEAAAYEPGYDAAGDRDLALRRYLINPMNFIGTGEKSKTAGHFRIRLGASDADTSLSVAMTLAIRLANAGIDTDFAFVWDLPHCDADYPGEILDWIDSICK